MVSSSSSLISVAAYSIWPSISQMPEVTQKFLKEYGIKQITPEIYTLHDDDEKSDATLSFRAIDPNDLPNLMPELESKTENIFG